MATFIARYPGRCGSSGCGERIHVGDEVLYATDDKIVHVNCDLATPTQTMFNPEVCPGCFVGLPLSGVCDDCD